VKENHPVNPNPETTDAPSTQDEPWWPRLADHINNWWMDRRPTGPALRQALRIPPWYATLVILATGAGLLAMAVTLVWWLVAGITSLVSGVVAGIRDAATSGTASGTHHLAAWSVTRTIIHPVRAYLDQHAAGLPVDAHTLWLAWLATTAGLFVLAVAGSRGARLGWIVSGTTTTAMVYAATPAPGQAVAAGLALTVWAVLSVAAFNQLFGTDTDAPVHLSIRLPRRPRPDQPEGDADVG
jgi:hypothetical protein